MHFHELIAWFIFMYFSRSWRGWADGFNPASVSAISVWVFNHIEWSFFFPFLFLCTFFPKCFWLYFHCTASCDTPSLNLGRDLFRALLVEKTLVKMLFKHTFLQLWVKKTKWTHPCSVSLNSQRVPWVWTQDF